MRDRARGRPILARLVPSAAAVAARRRDRTLIDLPSFRIGRLFGIPVEINASWLIVFALVAWTLSFTYFPEAYPGRPMAVDLVSGLLTSFAFFGSVVLHEMSHSLVARAGGTGIRKITLFVFGGVAQMEEEPGSPGQEFLMAVAGPGMSVALGVLSLGTFFVLRVAGVSDWFWAPFEYLFLINVYVAVFNLLPGFPLDGGRVLRAFLWWASGDLLKATRWASGAGRALGWMLVAVALVGVLRGVIDFIWLALLGWFLATMAQNAYRDQVIRSSVSRVTVGSRMSAPPVVVPGELTVQEMVDRYFLGGPHSQYPVAVAGELVGVLHMSAVRKIPRASWATTAVADLVMRDMADLFVHPDTTVDSVLSRLGPEGPGALLVVRDGRLAGILTRSDVIRAIHDVRNGA